MLTCWTLDNVKRHYSFYREFDLLMLYASVTLWKRNHPDNKCVIYVDKMTQEVLETTNATHLWDEVRPLGKNNSIDNSVFWASSKLQALRFVREPVVLMDNDFLAFKKLGDFLTDRVVVTHNENGKGYYPGPLDPYIRRTKHLLNRPNHLSVNCSFVFFPDYKFTQKYATQSLMLMEEFTKLKVPNSNYLVYSEQLLLKHLLDVERIEYDTLVNEIWHCNDGYFYETEKGLIHHKQQELFFRHYWMDKPRIYNSEDGFVYEEEVQFLKNVLAKDKKLDFEVIKNVNNKQMVR